VVTSDFFGNSQGGLTSDEQRVLRQFVAAYIERGQKPITVTVGGSGQSGQALADAVAGAAMAQGLAKSEVLIGIDPSQPADRVRASFISYTAVVPECGYWSDESTSNHGNLDSENFGCATQHNIGLMLADPSDLLADPASTPRDATRTVTGIEKYQAGQDPSAAWPTGPNTSIIDTAQ
jgi:pilus assembly protein CpaD